MSHSSNPEPDQLLAEESHRRADLLAALTERVRSRLTVDTRSLAALRILLGLTVLIDLLHRAGDIEVYYTDEGVYPLEAFEITYTQFNPFSIHALSGDLWFQQLLFVVAGLFALAFILGYRTRLVGVISLILLVSLQARNPALLNGGDRLFRVLFMIALLTPLGERWSIDALRRGSARTTVIGVTTAALLVQPLVVFGQNAVLKHGGETWYAGEALEIAFANDVMTVYLGNHLFKYPTLLEALNWIWVTLLAGSVVFLFLTDGRLRAFFTIVYITAFLGMIPTLMVGLFPLVLTASVLAYLTPPFWDALGRRVPPSIARLRPTRSQLGPLAGPPVERGLFESLHRRGYDSAVSYVEAYGRSLLTVLGVMALAYMLLFGAMEATGQEPPFESDFTSVMAQSWGLYAPDPSDSFSWYVVEAELDDGSTVNALGDGEVTMDRPPDAAETFSTFRERKLMSAVENAGPNGIIAERYADWACRQANERYDGRVVRVTVFEIIQSSPLDGTYDRPSSDTIIEYGC